jgi:GT2 family glycosyltransferase
LLAGLYPLFCGKKKEQERFMTPLVSIVVPVHGGAPFLREALNSVAKQTFRDFDLWIILDRPTADSRHIASSFIGGDFEVKVIESDAPGISAALNCGIESSNSKYIARLDSDDEMNPIRLQTQVSAFERNPDLACLGSQVEYIDANGVLTGRSNLPTTVRQLKSTLPALNCLIHPSVMIRTSALMAVGGYRGYLDGAEDYNLWLRLLKVGSIANLNEYLTRYRQHSSQVSKFNSSISPWLDSVARLDAMSPQGLRDTRAWSAELNSLGPSQREFLVSAVESDEAGVVLVNRLRSIRSFSIYLVGPRGWRLKNAAKALLRTPVTTFCLVFSLLIQKGKGL